ncbi:MAG: hypothetical protein PF542_04200 [Nanoarchaeota archaeon]|jgi:hypothetical protein|nr:hypothetical protein [Nanoarchaeota archaeon]
MLALRKLKQKARQKKLEKLKKDQTAEYYEERARHLKTLEEQYKHGGLSKKAYDELKGKL